MLVKVGEKSYRQLKCSAAVKGGAARGGCDPLPDNSPSDETRLKSMPGRHARDSLIARIHTTSPCRWEGGASLLRGIQHVTYSLALEIVVSVYWPVLVKG